MKIYANTDLIVEGEKISYKLSTGLDIEKNIYYMPCLMFLKNEGMLDEEELDSWDNDAYIIGTAYNKVICPWIESNSIPYPQEFSALVSIEGVTLGDFSIIFELLTKAMDMGMFNEYLNKENGGENNNTD